MNDSHVHLTVLCTSSPLSHYSFNSNFDIESSGHFKPASSISSSYYYLFCLLDKTCCEKASHFERIVVSIGVLDKTCFENASSFEREVVISVGVLDKPCFENTGYFEREVVCIGMLDKTCF